MFNEYSFALCLTHDVDRPYETFQPPYYALRHRDPSRLKSLFTAENPYWQFDAMMKLEDNLGVRSSFYFLNEQRLLEDRPPTEWIDPQSWKLYAGRYDVSDPEIADVISLLDDGGWEIGLHGSYHSYDDRERLREEKQQLEEVLGGVVIGGRQHYLNLNRPETWRHHREIGLRYDATLGSTSTYGFEYGYEPIRPFDDEFLVFPLTVMDVTLFDDRSYEAARDACVDLLWEAKDHAAVMTVVWHPKTFNETDFPGFRDLYIEMIRIADDLGAWIGPCRDLYELLTTDRFER